MKKIIPFLAAMLLLAGCGNNSTGSQANPMNSSSSESPSSPGGVNSPPSQKPVNVPSPGAMTNSPATNSNEMNTNRPAVTTPSSSS